MRCADFGPTPGSTRSASMSWSISATSESAPIRTASSCPAAIGMPAVAADMRDCDSALTLLTASLNAAAIRSSAISGSASTDGSMRTLRHSMRPLIVTLTMPPPDWPVTSSLASSSCARCMFSCIFCACCISWAMFPFMGAFSRVGRRRGQASSKGRMESGTTLAPWRCIRRCTSGSPRKAASAATWRASRSRAVRWCSVSPRAVSVSKRICGGRAERARERVGEAFAPGRRPSGDRRSAKAKGAARRLRMR